MTSPKSLSPRAYGTELDRLYTRGMTTASLFRHLQDHHALSTADAKAAFAAWMRGRMAADKEKEKEKGKGKDKDKGPWWQVYVKLYPRLMHEMTALSPPYSEAYLADFIKARRGTAKASAVLARAWLAAKAAGYKFPARAK